jgi:hypothetical protein
MNKTGGGEDSGLGKLLSMLDRDKILAKVA